MQMESRIPLSKSLVIFMLGMLRKFTLYLILYDGQWQLVDIHHGLSQNPR